MSEPESCYLVIDVDQCPAPEDVQRIVDIMEAMGILCPSIEVRTHRSDIDKLVDAIGEQSKAIEGLAISNFDLVAQLTAEGEEQEKAAYLDGSPCH